MFEFGASHKHRWTQSNNPGELTSCSLSTKTNPDSRAPNGSPVIRHSVRAALCYGWRLNVWVDDLDDFNQNPLTLPRFRFSIAAG